MFVNTFEVGHKIEEDLDGILNLRISEIQDKYDYKYESIAKCDDLFDATNLQIESIGSQLELNINLAKELIKKLEEQQPAEDPTDEQEKDYLNLISDKIEEAHAHLKDLEDMQTEINEQGDEIIDFVELLNDIGDKVIKQPEIDQILESIQKI